MLYNQEWDKKPQSQNGQIADLLNRAADVITERGHTKGTLVNKDGSPCALGAILIASGNDVESIRWGSYQVTPLTMATIEALSVRVRPLVNRDKNLVLLDGLPVPNWNNAPERTGEEVIAKFREVAAELVDA